MPRPTAKSKTGSGEVQKFLRRVEVLVARLDDLGCDLDDVRLRLNELAALDPGFGSAVKSVLSRGESLVTKPALPAAARQAMTVEFEWVDTRRAVVRIDGRATELPKRLAELFYCLKQASGSSSDALLPWMPREEIHRWFAKQTLPLASDHALENLVSRLRQRLAARLHMHPDFVQTDPVRGVRLAAQRATLAFDPGL